MSCNSGKRIKFFTAVNQAYYPYAKALANSLKENDGESLIIYSINFDARDCLRVRHDMVDAMVGKFSYEAAFCMRFRARAFAPMLLDYFRYKDGPTFLFWIDADSLVRKPLDELYAHVADCYVTAKQKGENEYASGVLGISTDAIPFARTYEKLVRKDDHWKSDQRNLAVAIDLYRDQNIFKPLPEKFCDTGFADDSPIWTAKIKCHNDPKWIKEYEHYLPR